MCEVSSPYHCLRHQNTTLSPQMCCILPGNNVDNVNNDLQQTCKARYSGLSNTTKVVLNRQSRPKRHDSNMEGAAFLLGLNRCVACCVLRRAS
jgi:hypothetical protein